MTDAMRTNATKSGIVTEEEPAVEARAPSGADSAIESILERADVPDVATSPSMLAAHVAPAPALRIAKLVDVDGRRATIAWRSKPSMRVAATVAPDIDRELLVRAKETGDAVLVEHAEGDEPVVVGVVQTRIPAEIVIRAGTVRIEGDREVLIRSGRAGARLREDGDIEIVGSRISAASRGLFRIVGRLLRLN